MTYEAIFFILIVVFLCADVGPDILAFLVRLIVCLAVLWLVIRIM
jgi:hypothetical protein